jgi:hypothetical protein
MELANHPGATAFFLVKVHVAGTRRLKYSENRMVRRNSQLGHTVIPQISAQWIVLIKMSEVPADHRHAPRLKAIDSWPSLHD